MISLHGQKPSLNFRVKLKAESKIKWVQTQHRALASCDGLRWELRSAPSGSYYALWFEATNDKTNVARVEPPKERPRSLFSVARNLRVEAAQSYGKCLKRRNGPLKVHRKLVLRNSAELNNDALLVIVRYELKILDRCHSYAAIEVQNEGANSIIPARRFIVSIDLFEFRTRSGNMEGGGLTRHA